MKKDNPVFTDKQLLGVKDFQGGLSDELFCNSTIQQYIVSCWIENKHFKGYNVFGYLGSYERTLEQDEQVEKALREAGHTTKQIAQFLISTEARHFADSLSHKRIADAVKALRISK